MRILICIGIFFLFSLVNVQGQTSVSNLLKSHSWIRCYDNLYVPDSLTDEKKESCRDEFIFKNDGTIEYIDHARDYDPYDRDKGCSNSFLGYTGTWSIWEGVVFITLNYQTISEEKFLVYKYRVNYVSKTELSLVNISDWIGK